MGGTYSGYGHILIWGSGNEFIKEFALAIQLASLGVFLVFHKKELSSQCWCMVTQIHLTTFTNKFEWCNYKFIIKCIIIPTSMIVDSWNIGIPLAHQSVNQSVHQSISSHTFLHNGWMDFLHVWCNDHVPWVKYNLALYQHIVIM